MTNELKYLRVIERVDRHAVRVRRSRRDLLPVSVFLRLIRRLVAEEGLGELLAVLVDRLVDAQRAIQLFDDPLFRAQSEIDVRRVDSHRFVDGNRAPRRIE